MQLFTINTFVSSFTRSIRIVFASQSLAHLDFNARFIENQSLEYWHTFCKGKGNNLNELAEIQSKFQTRDTGLLRNRLHDHGNAMTTLRPIRKSATQMANRQMMRTDTYREMGR